ncbi:hypothetical protein Gotur_001843 [Gossypium turneri]
MWEDWYDYIPTREPIIVPELAYVPKYMPWFRILGKPYLLSEEERRRPINSAHTITRPITRPSNSTHTVTEPNISTENTHSTAFSDDARCAVIARGIARGAIGELLFLPIPITL